MESMTESLAFIEERGTATRPVLNRLAAPPTAWVCPPLTPEVFRGLCQVVTDRIDEMAERELDTRDAALAWDLAADDMRAEVVFGLAMARLHFENEPEKLGLFAGLRVNDRGRESRHKQGLEFEKAWKKADAAWVFKEGVTLADFRQRRLALRDLEEAHMEAVKDEQWTRGLLHKEANALNDACVKWYDAATATFGEKSVPGVLVRTIPTTYDPNRPPGPLVFRAHASPEAGRVDLAWRAPRGDRYIIEALPPGATEWTMLLDGVKETSWRGEGLAGGFWKFRGRAVNAHGEGTMSEIIEVAVAAARAA